MTSHNPSALAAKPRVHFLGNSHLAAIKQALAARVSTDFSDFECTFFGAPGARMANLALDGDYLKPTTQGLKAMLETTSGGLSRIPLSTGDFFVLVGLDYNFQRLAHILRDYHLYSACVASAHLISTPCLKQSLRDSLRESTAVQLARKIRSASAKPIYMIPEPFPSTAALEIKAFAYFNLLRKRDLLAPVERIYSQCIEDAAQDEKIHLIPQPRHTLAIPGFTDRKYTKGAPKGDVRLHGDQATEHTSDNYRHMNDDFGFLVLNTLFSALRKEREHLAHPRMPEPLNRQP